MRGSRLTKELAAGSLALLLHQLPLTWSNEALALVNLLLLSSCAEIAFQILRKRVSVNVTTVSRMQPKDHYSEFDVKESVNFPKCLFTHF